MAGKTLSDYLLQELREVASRPTLRDMRARLESRPIASLPVAPTEAVRRERDDR
ncbi:MAG: hypothetical protein M5U07_02790 [Xanthobacteraceae bacterium]|nr:hypothetical protein [Xanthobacteraceae bacterium]